MLMHGKINMAMSCAFLGLYLFYVITVFLQDRLYDSSHNSESAKKARKLVKMTELDEIK